ncbi:MAG: hypothetical protein A2508_10265 [Candidatus Lambdaproteobacteria bacterium RIFOXYD12_FULL_49_8]|uniref:Outer membrane protein beta-barrel domain-containing protein n=1 Tax=Candidatus Lambdaproteobacteria bacterium RIFOXYD2_FULL_50_16 TaxID=1817772 RepID=A0A1F6GFF5_9PROT|nr:MAG: hypothetical protein A2527_00815 [Candidatus Lambdaproteobacteria bacterium RIFOXYD2_FULL_50_16]OGG97759.1 MAG: hypothetical protein A2508_10265 [Candidatus Lambdaproteobacteria bacterium RIFOXYD12_FULL_49_8]
MRTRICLSLIALLLWSLPAQAQIQALRFLTPEPSSHPRANFEDSTYLIENQSRRASGFDVGLRFKSGWGFGVSKERHFYKADTTFKYYQYYSGTDTLVELDYLNLNYSFGDKSPFTLGFGLLRSGTAEIVYDNPVCSQFNRKASSVSGQNINLDWTWPMGNPWGLIIGYRLSQTSVTFPGFAAGSYNDSVGWLGLDYKI